MPTPLIDLTGLFQTGLHLSTGTMFLEGEITHGLSSHLAKSLHVLSIGGRPITIYLSTLGGSRTASLGMYDLIRACPNHVTIIGYGDVSSAGILILQAADTRLLLPNTRLMMHPGASQTGFCLDENVIRQAKDNVSERDQFYALIGKRAGLSLADMLTVYSMDTYMNARRAVKLGLADRIA